MWRGAFVPRPCGICSGKFFDRFFWNGIKGACQDFVPKETKKKNQMKRWLNYVKVRWKKNFIYDRGILCGIHYPFCTV